MGTAEGARTAGRDTRTARGEKSGKPSPSKPRSKGNSVSDTKSGGLISAKGAAATKKQKQAEERQRQQRRYCATVTAPHD